MFFNKKIRKAAIFQKYHPYHSKKMIAKKIIRKNFTIDKSIIEIRN